MNPPGKTTLFRMQQAAQAEADRIAFTQDARIKAKLQSEPSPSEVKKRDDFIGIVRLINAVLSDKVMIEQIKSRMNLPALLATDVDASAEAEAADA